MTFHISSGSTWNKGRTSEEERKKTTDLLCVVCTLFHLFRKMICYLFGKIDQQFSLVLVLVTFRILLCFGMEINIRASVHYPLWGMLITSGWVVGCRRAMREAIDLWWVVFVALFLCFDYQICNVNSAWRGCYLDFPLSHSVFSSVNYDFHIHCLSYNFHP